MIRALRCYLKDKQVFSRAEGMLRLMGKPLDLAKQWKKDGIELLHIVDLDAQKGQATNMDIYDKLTYLVHVQVECGENEAIVHKLLGLGCRVVLPLPSKIDLKKFTERKRWLVGKIVSNYAGSVDDVHDLIVESATVASVKNFAEQGKRVLVFSKDFQPAMEKWVFGTIADL